MNSNMAGNHLSHAAQIKDFVSQVHFLLHAIAKIASDPDGKITFTDSFRDS